MKNVKKIITAVIISLIGTIPITANAEITNEDLVQANVDIELSENTTLLDKDKSNDSNLNNLNGWQTIDGSKYYYNNNIKITGWYKLDNKWYYFDTDGTMKTGWITVNNNRYYLYNSGIMATGLTKIGENSYIFSNSGEMLTGWKFLSNNNWYYFNGDGTMKTGWFLDNNFQYYLNDDGTMSIGWTSIDGKDYYFNKSGAMRCGWVGIGKDIYYLDNKGAKVTNSTIDGYNLDENGKLILNAGDTQPNIDTYFLSKNININTDECDYKSDNKGIAESTFKGIDISNHNGYADFNAVKNAGIKAVYMKASESDYFIDKYAAENCKNAKANGLKVGFYHYLTGKCSPESQARLFYECIRDKPNDLKPCIDVEVSPSTALDYTKRFINEFKKYSDMDLCIYTYTNFISNFDSSLSSYSLWEANYNNSPFTLPSNGIWTSKAGHQYTSEGYVPGINGYVDLDIFNHDILL